MPPLFLFIASLLSHSFSSINVRKERQRERDRQKQKEIKIQGRMRHSFKSTLIEINCHIICSGKWKYAIEFVSNKPKKYGKERENINMMRA